MSDKFTLHAAPRTVTGKAVAQLRRDGRTPAVVYGRGTEPVALHVETRALARLFQSLQGGHDLTLVVEGEAAPRQVRLQDLQQHVTRHTPLHADFLQTS